MVPPGKVQIPGFTDKDTHKEVIMKGAQGLVGIESSTHQLSLLISNLVKDLYTFQVVNLGHLEITQLNLEGHKPEESVHLGFLCPLPKEMKKMILMMIVRYIASYLASSIVSMSNFYSTVHACLAVYIGQSW